LCCAPGGVRHPPHSPPGTPTPGGRPPAPPTRNLPPPPPTPPPPQGYRYALYAQQPNGTFALFAKSATPPPPPPASVSSIVYVPNSQWELRVYPARGFTPGWRGPMLATTTIAAALIGLLVGAVMVGRRQQGWLLAETRVGGGRGGWAEGGQGGGRWLGGWLASWLAGAAPSCRQAPTTPPQRRPGPPQPLPLMHRAPGRQHGSGCREGAH
jgi:hypothetical protein